MDVPEVPLILFVNCKDLNRFFIQEQLQPLPLSIYSSPVNVRDKHYLISLFQFGIEISEPMEYCSIQENDAVVKGHLTLHGKCFLTEDRVITSEPVEQLHNGGSRWNGFLKGERAQAFMAKVPSQISLRLKGDF